MFLNYEPGDFVTNPNNKDWGIGQIQSIINNKITVNFENSGKKVINAKEIVLEKVNKFECFGVLGQISFPYFPFYFTGRNIF